MIRRLVASQTHDPARGSFLVHPLAVKGKPGVMFSANHVDEKRVIPHVSGYEFRIAR